MYKLFLDDERIPRTIYPEDPVGWVVIRSYSEFVKIIEGTGLPKILSFDHDLAEEHYDPAIWRDGNPVPYDTYKEKTGYDCAKWLISKEHDLRNIDIRVHSYNPVGAKNIRMLLENWNKHLNKNV